MPRSAIFPSFLVLFLVSCASDGSHSQLPATQRPDSTTAPPGPSPLNLPPSVSGEQVQLHSLRGSGLQFNGVYALANGNILYYMRFFERGNVVLIAGRQPTDGSPDLRTYLKQDAQGGVSSLHNAPVALHGDSLFFTTMTNRGAITYAGSIHGDSLRFLKHSTVTGKQAELVYWFLKD